MRVLFVTSEAVPFAKTGGLADVCGALPLALARLGVDVRLVMPRYGTIPRDGFVRHPAPLGVPTGLGERWCAVLEGRLPRSGVPVYLIEHDALFDRPELYGPGGRAYHDNCLRFTVLSRGALNLCHAIGWYPDVVHCHDWQAALVPTYMRLIEKGSPLGRAASVLTVHNLAYQGRFGSFDFQAIGLDFSHFNWTELELYGDLNVLKGGIVYATLVSTVSPNYAREIQTDEMGEGLAGVLRDRAADLTGILNGIDEEVWNPQTDPLLPANYSADDLAGKAVCKAELERRMGLEPRRSRPLAGFVGRLVDQKGVDILIDAADDLVRMGVNLVVLATGDPHREWEIARLAERNQGFRAVLGFDDGLAHLFQGGCDMLLMPSRYEPCGLGQLYGLRYGCVPIVHSIGGLADSVVDPCEGEPTGFKLYEPTPAALVGAVERAVLMREREPERFLRLVRRGMRQPLGWQGSAARYLDLYEQARRRVAR